MKLRYVVADPTGNITALVLPELPKEYRKQAVKKLLTGKVEQVGFVEMPPVGFDGALTMMGGEFCGNATMSLGAYLCRYEGIFPGAQKLKISGASEPVFCTVEKSEEGYRGTVSLQKPEKIEKRTLPGFSEEVTVVTFAGITHVLCSRNVLKNPDALAVTWCEFLNAEALGVLALSENWDAMEPVVYVPASGSLVHESCCGSGSAAVGAALARKEGRDVVLPLSQPGGVLTVRAGGKDVSISGTVKLSEILETEI